MGVGAAAVVVAATGVITGAASGAGEVHPAVTSTAQQISASERVRMSIQDDRRLNNKTGCRRLHPVKKDVNPNRDLRRFH
jgi:hypothetical protein